MIIKKNFFVFSILLIIVLSFAIYSNSFYADFQFDDGVHIAKQQNLNDFERFSEISSWTKINERPLSFFTLSLNHYIHGNDVFGYHLFNLIIHILAGIFVYLLSVLLFKNVDLKSSSVKMDERFLAVFVALIFISHPIQTQSVTYIVQRMTSMLALFYIAAVYFYLYGRLEYLKGASISKAYLFYFLSFIFSIAAILTKQTAASIPLALALVEFFFVRNFERKICKKYLSSFVGLIVLFCIFIIAAGMIPKETVEISRADYLVTQFRVLVKYVQLLIFPISQNLDYDFSLSTSIWGIKEMASLLFCLALLYLAVRLFKKYRILSFAILWIFVSLLIESSIIPIKDVIFEHRLYLPMFGFALISVSVFISVFRIQSPSYLMALMLIVTMLYGFKTYDRNKVWKTRVSLWTDVVEKSPKKARAHMNLGEAYFSVSNHKMALHHYNKAIEVEDAPSWLGYFNRAEVAAYLGKPKVAILDLNQSIRFKNDFADAYDSRGVAKIQIQDYQSAVVDFNRSIEIKPHMESAWFNRANAKTYLKDFKGALSDYNKAIQLNPQFAEAYNNRGQLKLNLKQFDEAIDDLNNAVKINPNFIEAYNNRAKVNMSQNFFDAAIADLTKSLLLDKRSALVYRYRAMCFFRQSNYKLAYDDFLRAAQLGDTIAPQFSKELELKFQNQKNR